MQLDIISYADLALDSAATKLVTALLQNGVVGISNIPSFESKSRAYVEAARSFIALNDDIKNQYAPNRDQGETEGFEKGAERFKDAAGNWIIDDKKTSYYAFIPDQPKNKWPNEVDLKSAYLDLGLFIFEIGKELLKVLEINEKVGIPHELLSGYGRLLHYSKDSRLDSPCENWCGAHFDHGIFTGLMPAYYFQDGKEIAEPEEAGLYIVPTHGSDFVKVTGYDQSVLLFQIGEFGQLASNDRIRATNHLVKKANTSIERYAFAVFYDVAAQAVIKSTSTLIEDSRYANNKQKDGSITYGKWSQASFERYRAR